MVISDCGGEVACEYFATSDASDRKTSSELFLENFYYLVMVRTSERFGAGLRLQPLDPKC